MKIYFYLAHLGAGGSERVAVNFANELIERGHEVHIVALNLDINAYSHLLSEKCILHSLGVSRIRYSIVPLLKFIRREKPEQIVVFSHELLVWMNYLKKFRLINCRIILRNQSNLDIAYTEKTEISPLVQGVLRNQCKVIRNVDAVISQCNAMTKQLIEQLEVPEEKITCIYNPVSKEVVEKAIRLRENRVKGRNIVMIGRLDTTKNTEHMIRAFAGLKERAGNETATLEIVGEGYKREKLENLIKELGLNDYVNMNGIRKDIENVYAKADIIALSSTYEGMPNVLIEAIAIGIPVLSYDCPVGPAEIVVHGENGYLAEYLKIESLTDYMEQILDKSWDEKKIRESADKFNVKHAVDKLLKVLQ